GLAGGRRRGLEIRSTYQKNVDDIAAKIEMGAQGKEQVLQDQKEVLAKLDALISQATAMDRFAGKLYASSGFRQKEENGNSFALDWSLVRLAPGRERSIGKEVANCGRTTGWTTGTLNGIETVFKAGSTLHKVQTHALVVFTPPNATAPGAGDSGSVVVSVTGPKPGSWLGLSYAMNQSGKMGYMTPISMVLEDIELVTWRKVLEPSFWEGS
ncbi:hypothetical protein FQN57_004323, partial [Myotisia sp. PD_48]